MLQYSIEAYSPTANQTLRQVYLNNLQMTPTVNLIEANQQATTFAYTLNQQAKLGAQDWAPKVTPIGS